MKQTELVKAFVNGATQGEAKSLHLVGDQLIHYNTPIAERHGGKIILNYTGNRQGPEDDHGPRSIRAAYLRQRS